MAKCSLIRLVSSAAIALLLLITAALAEGDEDGSQDANLDLDSAMTRVSIAYSACLQGIEEKGEQGLLDLIVLLEEAVRDNPQNAGARADLGTAYLYLKRFDDAEKQLKEATRLDPQLAVAYSNLGVVYMQQGRLEEALNAYQAAIRTDPEYADAYCNLGAAYLGLERFEEAITA